ncbi:GNAT family N-acetyltransferase [Ferrimonas senticii]|uniref:GNAT family N-acetyltransferase n=1 Tax=Ferrimonas senticii TaxID=394566 RepID=UPI00040EC382|nr:GNAT family N-acetyltransferase [Ferrimonas senticii]
MSDSNHLIVTPRLAMRRFTLDDAEAVLGFSGNTQVTRYTGDAGMVKTLEDAKRIIETIWLAEYAEHGYARYALLDKARDRVIGFCGWKFEQEVNLPDLGYRLLPQYWGQGLGMEAASAAMVYGRDTLGFSEVSAELVPENLGSKRIIERLGFTLTDQYHYRGGGLDCLINRYRHNLKHWQAP